MVYLKEDCLFVIYIENNNYLSLFLVNFHSLLMQLAICKIGRYREKELTSSVNNVFVVYKFTLGK